MIATATAGINSSLLLNRLQYSHCRIVIVGAIAMPSPFPGMDPFLEGYLWPDVHNALANKIRQVLVPQLRPRYTARLEIYLAQDTDPASEIGILYPDVEVLKAKSSPLALPIAPPSSRLAVITPAALTLPVMPSVVVRIPVVEIRDVAENQLVACIEILSPVNKREPGLSVYRQKRQRLYQADVHLIEIDLLRRGTRPFAPMQLPPAAYFVLLTRSGSGQTEIWPIALPAALPVIPIPLKSPDPDAVLDLNQALQAIYDEAAYDLSIDYQQSPPPPALSKPDQQWYENITA